MIEVLYEKDLPVEILVDGYYIVEKKDEPYVYFIYDPTMKDLGFKPTLHQAITYVKRTQE